MWFLVVFYIGTTTPPTIEMFHMRTRDECRKVELETIQMLLKDPQVGVKHKTLCKKIDVA